jgi:sterol 3beta-glucosyltransferase
MGINGEEWEETVLGDGVGRRKGGAEASGLVASSSFAEGMGEFVLRSMDARFSGSVDDDELYVSSRQPGTSPDCLCLVPPFRWACDF